MNFRILILTFCLSLSTFDFYGQEGIPVYSDYLSDNWYLLHPSMAGASTKGMARLTARQQWFDIEDAPALQTLSVNSRVGDKVGIGGIVFNDKNGYFSQLGAYATFAYHLVMSRGHSDLNQLSFGMSVGLIQSRLDESNFDLTDFDPLITGGQQVDSYMNIDFGMSYNYLDFSSHLTVKNALPAKRDAFSEDFESTNQRRFLASFAYAISTLSTDWSFEPSVLLQYTSITKESSFDINLKSYKKFDWGKFWGGLSYRRSFNGAEFTNDGTAIGIENLQYITPFLGANYERFLLAYTYSYQNNSIVLSNGGFHQLTLGVDFGDYKDPYDCNCPAVN